MRRFTFSLRSHFVAIAVIAILLAVWMRYGEYLLFGLLTASLFVLVSGFLPIQNFRPFRGAAASLVLSLMLFLASLGPASWAYTMYDPGYWQSPMVKRGFGLVYDPVGRCYAFPLDPWHDCCLSYVRWWMPANSEIQDYGWGIGLRSNGGLFVVGTGASG